MHGHEVIRVTNVSHSVTKAPLPMFIVEFKQNPNNKHINKIEFLIVVVFHHEIRPMWPVAVSIWTPSKRRLRGLPGRLLRIPHENENHNRTATSKTRNHAMQKLSQIRTYKAVLLQKTPMR
jgi:hypothetical protein